MWVECADHRELTMPYFALFALLLLVSPLVGAPVPKSIKPKDKDLIVGTWKLVKLDSGWGERSPSPGLPRTQYVFGKAGHFSQTNLRSSMSESSFKIDSDQDLKTLDITVNGHTSLGLYELDGDTLRICWSKFNTICPTEFKAEKDVSSVITLKWVKDETKDK